MSYVLICLGTSFQLGHLRSCLSAMVYVPVHDQTASYTHLYVSACVCVHELMRALSVLFLHVRVCARKSRSIFSPCKTSGIIGDIYMQGTYTVQRYIDILYKHAQAVQIGTFQIETYIMYKWMHIIQMDTHYNGHINTIDTNVLNF